MADKPVSFPYAKFNDLDIIKRIKSIDAFRVSILLCALFFFFYVGLAISYPTVYWSDAHDRLALRNQILLGYLPPVMQTLVFVIWKIGGDLLLLRSLLSLIAVCTLFCIYFLASRFFSNLTGLFALILLGTNLVYTALATVPYPEVLFVGLVFLALGLRENSPNGGHSFYYSSLVVNIACLTRYEGWLLAVVFVSEEGVRYLRLRSINKFTPSLLRIVLLILAPLGWLVFFVSEPGGLFVRLDSILNFTTGFNSSYLTDRFLSRLSIDYIRGFACNFIHLLKWQAGTGILVFGLIGWVLAFKSGSQRNSHLRILFFLLLDLLLIAFWGPWDFTNLRQVFLWEVFLIFYAAYGLEQSAQFVFQTIEKKLDKPAVVIWDKWLIVSLAISLVPLYVPSAINFVAITSQASKFSIPAKIGFWLESRLSGNDVVLVLSDDPFQRNELSAYVSLSHDAILDDKYDDQYIYSHLAKADQVYVIQLYESRSGLSLYESKILTGLESGEIRASSTVVAERILWKTDSKEIANYYGDK